MRVWNGNLLNYHYIHWEIDGINWTTSPNTFNASTLLLTDCGLQCRTNGRHRGRRISLNIHTLNVQVLCEYRSRVGNYNIEKLVWAYKKCFLNPIKWLLGHVLSYNKHISFSYISVSTTSTSVSKITRSPPHALPFIRTSTQFMILIIIFFFSKNAAAKSETCFLCLGAD